MFLLNHSYSCLYGNFLSNKQKDLLELEKVTVSIWQIIFEDKSPFLNPLWKGGETLTVLSPELHLLFWKEYYLRME